MGWDVGVGGRMEFWGDECMYVYVCISIYRYVQVEYGR